MRSRFFGLSILFLALLALTTGCGSSGEVSLAQCTVECRVVGAGVDDDSCSSVEECEGMASATLYPKIVDGGCNNANKKCDDNTSRVATKTMWNNDCKKYDGCFCTDVPEDCFEQQVKDTDGDGVPDEDDECDEEPCGQEPCPKEPSDKYGCPKPEYPKEKILDLKWYSQKNFPWCWAAACASVLEWYYRGRAETEDFDITPADIARWTWGSSDFGDKNARNQGVALMNMLGAYNTLCPKTTPGTVPEKGNCDNSCDRCATCLWTDTEPGPVSSLCENTCAYAAESYDPTCHKCCDPRWIATESKEVHYQGKHQVCMNNPKPLADYGNVTSYAWGMNCILLTAYIKWPAANLMMIESVGTGVISPLDFVKEINAGRPVLIDYGKVKLHDGDRHSVVVIGYTLSGEAPTEAMTLHYLDPRDRPFLRDYYSAKYSRFKNGPVMNGVWNQTLLLTTTKE